ncbi:MAG: hypothetical protein KKA61_02080 [Nanoarchaeota archaeon]|nr:hypothetical protein [Nanoarchaeota archaeon]
MELLLRQIGLTEYEVKAYLALLKTEPTTAYKLGKLSGIPTGRIYDVADNLVSKGMIAVLSGRPKYLKAINPKIAVSALLTKKENEWKKNKEQINKIINKLEKKKIQEEPITLSKGRESFYYNILDLHNIAKKELLTIVGGLTAVKKGVDLETASKTAIKRGVNFRMILPLNKKNEDSAKEMIKMGINIRSYPIKGLRLNIVDGKICVLTLVDKSLSYERATIRVENPVFCRGMKHLFNALWEKAKPIT